MKVDETCPWGKTYLSHPNTRCDGKREEDHPLPNLGVREGFLKEMVLELFGKDIRESERRRGFQAEGAAQEREGGICPCKQLSLSGAWSGCMDVVRGDAAVEATFSGGQREALRVLNSGVR